MKLIQLQEATYANQITGIYLVLLFKQHSLIDNFKQPLYDKTNKVLFVSVSNLRDAARSSLTTDTTWSVRLAVFGSNPYERLRRFMDQYFDEQLDDHDFGVSSILDNSRNYRPQRNFGDLEGNFKEIYNALKRAKSI